MKSAMLKKFLVAEEQKEDMGLQITSMADIFTIILIFLLKSFATGMATISPPQGMVLPSVSTTVGDRMREGVKIEILPNSILVDNKVILRTQNFQVETEGGEANESGAPVGAAVVPRIVEVLTRERSRAIASSTKGHLIVLAHEKAPYSTVRAVLNSAASAGFADLQLVAVGVSE